VLATVSIVRSAAVVLVEWLARLTLVDPLLATMLLVVRKVESMPVSNAARSALTPPQLLIFALYAMRRLKTPFEAAFEGVVKPPFWDSSDTQ
jgi:hypothetical protein